jgi:F-type H+-transporting ATPase subunit b
MRRRTWLVPLLALALAIPALAEEKKSGEGEGGLKGWMWANFLVLAGGLGYLAGKQGGPFFAARSRKISKDMIEAGDYRKRAEAKAAEVESRLAGLEANIAALREEARAETDAETERIARATDAEMAKLQAGAEMEIASAAKMARAELKQYAAGLAVELAERKIRADMTAAVSDGLVEEFVRDLPAPAPASKVQSI